jgi:hypothetical protein
MPSLEVPPTIRITLFTAFDEQYANITGMFSASAHLTGDGDRARILASFQVRRNVCTIRSGISWPRRRLHQPSKSMLLTDCLSRGPAIPALLIRMSIGAVRICRERGDRFAVAHVQRMQRQSLRDRDACSLSAFDGCRQRASTLTGGRI